MSLTSKSPRTVAIVALEVGKRTLPTYAHRFAPKAFTQPQLFACLVLKAFFRADYCGIEQYLCDLPELRRVLAPFFCSFFYSNVNPGGKRQRETFSVSKHNESHTPFTFTILRSTF